jgi:hypothetical protein
MGFFSGLSEDVLQELTKDLERIQFKKGEAIITEHSWAITFFSSVKGR